MKSIDDEVMWLSLDRVDRGTITVRAGDWYHEDGRQCLFATYLLRVLAEQDYIYWDGYVEREGGLVARQDVRWAIKDPGRGAAASLGVAAAGGPPGGRTLNVSCVAWIRRSVGEGVAGDFGPGELRVPDETAAYLGYLAGRRHRDRDRLGTAIPSLTESGRPHEIGHRRTAGFRDPAQSLLIRRGNPHRHHSASYAHGRSLHHLHPSA